MVFPLARTFFSFHPSRFCLIDLCFTTCLQSQSPPANRFHLSLFCDFCLSWSLSSFLPCRLALDFFFVWNIVLPEVIQPSPSHRTNLSSNTGSSERPSLAMPSVETHPSTLATVLSFSKCVQCAIYHCVNYLADELSNNYLFMTVTLFAETLWVISHL